MKKTDYARFQETFVKLGKLLESAGNWDEARTKLLMHTDNPAHHPELMRFLIQIENELESAFDPLLEPFESLYGGDCDE